MSDPIRVLIVEDSEDDSALLALAMERGGLEVECRRVDSRDAMRKAVKDEEFDIVLCDYVMHGFSVEAALGVLEDAEMELPVIVISGIVHTADVIEVLRSGAVDFVEKDDLARLVPAVERSLRVAEERRALHDAEDALRQAQKMEAVGQLTGGGAHDFNNLLAVVMGNAELRAEREEGDNQHLQAIVRAAARGAELTQRLLAFSRQQTLESKPFDMAELVSGVSDMLARTLGAPIDLKTVTAPDLKPALADSGQVENALLNLAINARDAMPEGGKLTIECMNVRLEDEYIRRTPEVVAGDYVLMAVSDTGMGIPEETLQHVFEPFFTTKDVGQGTGLGLSMVYGFAKQSGGHVAIYSEVGKGTTVRLYLPQAETDQADIASSLGAEVCGGKGETVLVIEDDEEVRKFAVEALEILGYRTLDAGDAGAARDLLAEPSGGAVDLVLSDVVLPGGVSGPAFAAEIGEQHPSLKFIFMSGYPAEAASRKGLLKKTDILLGKPFRPRQLAEAIHRALT